MPTILRSLLVLVAFGLVALVPMGPTAVAQDPSPGQPQPDTQPQPAEPDEDAERAQANVRYLDEVVGRMRSRYYDRRTFRSKWPAIREQHLVSVKAAVGETALYAAVNAALGELKVSHLAVIHGYVFRTYVASEMQDDPTLRPGFELIRIGGPAASGGKFFIGDLYEEGCARKAGVRLGDEVVQINGTPTADHPDLLDAGSDPGIAQDPHFVIRLHNDDPITLTLRRTAEGETMAVTVTPVASTCIRHSRASVQVFEVNGKRIGYVHTWHFLTSAIAEIVYNAINGAFRDCDGMILDIRGRGGSPMVIQQLLAALRKSGRGGGMFNPPAPRWTKPAVVLINGHSRSAKEIFAHEVKTDSLAVLVGTPTAGAVLAANFLPLTDGSHLMIPIYDARRFVGDRTQLEGNPVTPHFRVRDAALPYANGRDAILEAGKKVMETLMKRADSATH